MSAYSKLAQPLLPSPLVKVCGSSLPASREPTPWTPAEVTVGGKTSRVEWAGTVGQDNTLGSMRIREQNGQEFSISLQGTGKGAVVVHRGANGNYRMNGAEIDTPKVRCIGADYGKPPTPEDFAHGAALFYALQKSPAYQAELRDAKVSAAFTPYDDVRRLETSNIKVPSATPTGTYRQ